MIKSTPGRETNVNREDGKKGDRCTNIYISYIPVACEQLDHLCSSAVPYISLTFIRNMCIHLNL